RAAHRAADDDRAIEGKRLPDSADEGEIRLGREPVSLEPPSIGRIRAAVVWQVERNHAEVFRDRLVGHEVPILAAVGAGGVEAQEWNSSACLFEIDAVLRVADAQRHIATDNRFEDHEGVTVLMTFIVRCSARAFCIATSVSPSSTNPGTRISIANTS